MTIAIIDLGSNTFHLLVAEVHQDSSFTILHKERQYVKLARAGLGYIPDEAFRKGMNVLQYFQDKLKELRCEKVIAVGTSALRNASNGKQFIVAVEHETGIRVQLISGEEEARLIYNGIKDQITFTGTSLIMDVGGGSVEFICFTSSGIQWLQSLSIGLGVLKNLHKESFDRNQISAIRSFLDIEMRLLFQQLQDQPIDLMIGAAGSFEILAKRVLKQNVHQIITAIDIDQLHAVMTELLECDVETLQKDPWIPEARIDMLPYGTILIQYVTEKIRPSKLVISTYSLKEGLLWEEINSIS